VAQNGDGCRPRILRGAISRTGCGGRETRPERM